MVTSAPPSLVRPFVEAAPEAMRPAIEAVSDLQRRLWSLVAEGRTMKEIASILGISPRTVESHKYEIMQVLGASTTAELIQYAIRIKLIQA